MTLTFKSFALIVGCSLLSFQACKKDDPATNSTLVKEFIADSNTFIDYMSWPLEATKHGIDPFLGMAHAGNDSTTTRMVHFKNAVKPVNGVYPVGSIIVKHTTNTAGTLNEVTGMVKRGNGFNPSKGDWEFFMLMPNGKIAYDGNMALRGADLMGGMCGSCHASASSKDFIFSK